MRAIYKTGWEVHDLRPLGRRKEVWMGRCPDN